MSDRVIGNALSYDCRIGFREYERHIRQRVVVDLVVDTDWRRCGTEDDPKGIVDYYEVNRRITALVGQREYRLIEAVAEDIAHMLCREFPITRAQVRVTKTPFDMPNVGSVAVECIRTPADYASPAVE